jgi:CheY-like chemotaxis protein
MARAAVGRRVLVVDSDAISRTVFKHTYVPRGHHVWLAKTAGEALELAASEPIEVVIYDWSFRDNSGVGLAAKLREACADPVAIIALTVLDEPDGFREREDVDDYLVKPALVETVELAFESALTRRRPSPTAAR